MSNTNKPAGQQLKAEEITQIAQAHFTRTRPGPLTEKIVNEMYGFEEGYRIATEHAAQQTAAKDARIAELEEKLKVDEVLKWQTAEQAIFSEMEGFWNEAQQRVWLPKLLKIIDQQTADKDARIKELKENYRQLIKDRDDYKEQTAALREELAATEKMMVKYKSDLDRSTAERLRQAQLLQSYKDGPENMEAAKKEREVVVNALAIVREQRNEALGALEKINPAYYRVVNELAAAVKLLEKWVKFSNNLNGTHWQSTRDFLSRLSSGETKPAGLWNDMPGNFPADGQKILIWPRAYEDPGKRIWQSNWEKGDWTGFKWAPYPAPPESKNE